MTTMLDFLAAAAGRTEDPDEKDEIYRLRRMNIKALHLVDRGANKRKILIAKNEEGRDMDTKDMIPGADATPTDEGVTIQKAEKLPTKIADSVVKMLDDASGRIQVLKSSVEGTEDMEKGGVSKGFVSELGNVQQILAGISEKFPTATQKAEGDGEEGDEEGGGEEDGMKKGEGAPAAPAPAAPPADPFTTLSTNIDAVIGIQKAGKTMSAKNWDLLSKAVDLLGQLTSNLTPAEKAKAEEKLAKVSKRLSVPPAPAAVIPEGNAQPGSETPVKPPESAGGWTSGDDINAE
jgi:hypothetical protein